MTAKINNYQLALLLLFSRLFSECVNFPDNFAKYEMQRFTVIITAKIILLILYIPLIILASKYPGESFFTILSGKSKILGWLVFIPACAVMIAGAVSSIVKLEFFTANTIMSTAPGWVLIILMAAVVIYGMLKGIQVMGRMGIVIFVLFMGLIVFGTISLAPRMNLLFLYPSPVDFPETLTSEILSEVCKNNEIFIYAVLCRYVSERPARTVYIYMPALLASVLYMTFLYIVMFGPFIEIISFPFYSLSSMIDIIIFNRLDGLDVILWLISAVVKIILFLICIESMLTSLIKEKPAKRTALIIGIAAFALGMFFTMNRDMLNVFFNKGEFFTAVLLLIIIAPLAALFIKRRSKNDGQSGGTPNQTTPKEQKPAVPETRSNLAFDELD